MNKSIFVGMVIGALAISLAASVLGTSSIQIVNAQNATREAENMTSAAENGTLVALSDPRDRLGVQNAENPNQVKMPGTQPTVKIPGTNPG